MEAPERSALFRSLPLVRSSWGPRIALVAMVLAWLWPFGIAGKMPVGGDVTNFSIGLMAELSRSLKSGAIPVWNANWGYGFAGLAESQMGVFYPPHVLLYGLLPLEYAYTLSLVLHTIFAACGAMRLAGRLGVGLWPSAFAGFVWSASGFFVIHFPHQWGYTTAAWAPWAWAFAWDLGARAPGRARAAALLAATLALQVLPGHFQIAFETQVCVVIILMCHLSRTWRWIPAVFVGSGLLALVQLGPTWRLARLASSARDWDYLSGFAASPLHLVSYVAPRLFHLSPLWRPVAWDPLHTSPEEHLAYIGIAPLFLALVALVNGLRGDGRTRLLTVLAVATAALSLGPHLPGFGWLAKLPGFSFFRAPARWGVQTDLALALLAAQGLGAIREFKRLPAAIAIFAGFAVAWTAVVVGGIELVLEGGEGAAPKAAEWLVPRRIWPADPSLARVIAAARRPQTDFRAISGLARQGWDPPPQGLALAGNRPRIYREELAHGLAAIAALLFAIPFARLKNQVIVYLFIITFADLWFLGRDRGVDAEPIAPLIERSSVLRRLSREPEGTRIASGLGNLPIAADVGALKAYRTLDLPAAGEPAAQASGPILTLGAERVAHAMAEAGASVRVIDPFELRILDGKRGGSGSLELEVVEDAPLAGWFFGTAWVRRQGPSAQRFGIWKPRQDVAAAVDDRGRPISVDRPTPALWILHPRADAKSIVIKQLADPAWRAKAAGRTLRIDRTSNGLERINLPQGAPGEIVLEFREPNLLGFAVVSAVSWTLWAAVIVATRRSGPTSSEQKL